MKSNHNCGQCPRRCGADRASAAGYCGCFDTPRVARVMPYFGEEPVISGTNGSGAVFFSGCVLRCPFCQNYPISHGLSGTDVTPGELGRIFLDLQEQGVHNINLITPTQYIDVIADVLLSVKSSLNIPVVYNTGGYELPEQLRRLSGLVDIYLPDMKYFSAELSRRYCGAADYFDRAIDALEEMLCQQPECVIENGIMRRGVIVRHLVLPGCYKDSMEVFRRIAERFDGRLPMASVMRQYTPCYDAEKFPELMRRVTTFEYRKVADLCARLGFDGFTQLKGCENLGYTPDFEKK